MNSISSLCRVSIILGPFLVLISVGTAWTIPPEFAVKDDPITPSTDVSDTTQSIVIGPSVTWLKFYNEDMDKTYGSFFLYGVNTTFNVDPWVQVDLGIHYGSSKGDPFYDDASFQADNAVRLKMLPICLGLKLMAPDERIFHLALGAYMSLTWCQETIYNADGQDKAQSDSGWFPSVGVTLTPQWHLDNGHKILSLEVGFGGDRSDIGHFVDLTALSAKVSYQIKL